MNFGKAMAIVIQIDSDEFTDEEKATAIYLVMNAPTHNSITKDNMLKVIKWLWDKSYEWFVPEAELKDSIREQEAKASEEIHSLCAEIRTLKKTNKAYTKECNRLICLVPKARAEAVKEFAVRLKGLSFQTYKGCFAYEITAENLNNLVKEMVGEG